MTFNICNLGSNYPYFNRAYVVSSGFGCTHLYGVQCPNRKVTLRSVVILVTFFFEENIVICVGPFALPRTNHAYLSIFLCISLHFIGRERMAESNSAACLQSQRPTTRLYFSLLPDLETVLPYGQKIGFIFKWPFVRNMYYKHYTCNPFFSSQEGPPSYLAYLAGGI